MLILLFAIQFLCLLGSVVCSIRMWRIAKKIPGKPWARRSIPTGTRYRVYNALFWTGFSVCNLMRPNNQSPLFWGFFTLLFLALAAASLHRPRFVRYMRRRHFSPDEQSMIHLGR
jgi:hypothetical protein